MKYRRFGRSEISIPVFSCGGMRYQYKWQDVLLEDARRLQKEGRVRFIGFSTHAPCRVIVQAIESGEFDYVNLHWYFVNPLNWPAVEAAACQDMGVFIISPSDKGGKLYNPPAKL